MSEVRIAGARDTRGRRETLGGGGAQGSDLGGVGPSQSAPSHLALLPASRVQGASGFRARVPRPTHYRSISLITNPPSPHRITIGP